MTGILLLTFEIKNKAKAVKYLNLLYCIKRMPFSFNCWNKVFFWIFEYSFDYYFNYQWIKGSTHWVDTFSSLYRSQDDVFHLQWAKYIPLYYLNLEVLSKNKDCQCSPDDESYCSGSLVQTLKDSILLKVIEYLVL